MARNRTLQSIRDLVGSIGSAINVSNAVEARRMPRSRDLRRLGIDPEQFKTLGL